MERLNHGLANRQRRKARNEFLGARVGRRLVWAVQVVAVVPRRQAARRERSRREAGQREGERAFAFEAGADHRIHAAEVPLIFVREAVRQRGTAVAQATITTDGGWNPDTSGSPSSRLSLVPGWPRCTAT